MEQLEKNYTENTAAFQEYLLGKHFLNNRTTTSIQTAVEHLSQAWVDHDKFPSFPLLAVLLRVLPHRLGIPQAI